LKRLLVDTHALLWWLKNDPSLSPTGRAELAAPANEVLVSTASIWEIAVKRSQGRLTVPEPLLEVIEREGFTWLLVSPVHAWAVSELPLHHRDPFDRLLIAQAQIEDVAIVTADSHFDAYDVSTSW
jgi:PIN domain nuclease of toxin-antitoxin system